MQDLRKAGGHENCTRVSHRYEHILPVLFFAFLVFVIIVLVTALLKVS